MGYNLFYLGNMCDGSHLEGPLLTFLSSNTYIYICEIFVFHTLFNHAYINIKQTNITILATNILCEQELALARVPKTCYVPSPFWLSYMQTFKKDFRF